jgi:serine/threonine-protein kinase
VAGLQASFTSLTALTRDGSRLAYSANGRIWIRRQDQGDATPVPGSEGGRAPFWSWDQSTLGFEAHHKLWTYALGSDQSKPLCDLPGSGSTVGSAWGKDGRIVMAAWRGGLYELSATGGEVRPLVPIDSSTVDFHVPSFLPDGNTVLVLVHDKGGKDAVALLEGSPPRLTRVYVDSMAVAARFSPTGHLLLSHEDSEYHSSTWAVPFSAASRKVTGAPFRTLDGASLPCVSDDGLLVAVPDPTPPDGQLAWMRREGGGVEPLGAAQPGMAAPALSPDGRRVAYVALQDATPAVWLLDLARGTRSRLTNGTQAEGAPAWSPDGQRIYLQTYGNVGAERIVSVPVDGGGSVDTLARGYMPALSPDGKTLVYVLDRAGNPDLWTVRLDGTKATQSFLATPSREAGPALSPDGRWIAYMSNESGATEIYLRRYPEGDLREQVSVGGGQWPRWSRRGDAIDYLDHDSLTAVSVGPAGPGRQPRLGLPHALFSALGENFERIGNQVSGSPFDVGPDGSRFLGVRRLAAATTPGTLLFVENWFAEFRGR